MQLNVVVPCYNEAEGIRTFTAEVARVLDTLDLPWQIVFVDDGSTDATLDELNALAAGDRRVRVYSLSRNFGHQIALSAGLDVTGESLVLLMDADLQHPPEVIPRLIAEWRRGADVVSTVRERTEDAGWIKRATASSFYWLINRMTDTPIIPSAADFCLLSPRAHRALSAMPERHRFLRGMISWIGFTRALVPFHAPKRRTGETKYSAFKMIVLALDAIFSFSAAPMRLATRLGFMLAVPGAIYFVWVVSRYFVTNDFVRGWGSLIGTVLIIGGVQLIFIGITGEYLARIFEESKHRPLYFFKQCPEDRLE
jgi:glycosyltransferase involved in cell wall biosynthesis